MICRWHVTVVIQVWIGGTCFVHVTSLNGIFLVLFIFQSCAVTTHPRGTRVRENWVVSKKKKYYLVKHVSEKIESCRKKNHLVKHYFVGIENFLFDNQGDTLLDDVLCMDRLDCFLLCPNIPLTSFAFLYLLASEISYPTIWSVSGVYCRVQILLLLNYRI